MAQSAPSYGYDDVTSNPATLSVSDVDALFLNVNTAHSRFMSFLTNE